MSDFRAIREEIEELMDLLEGYEDEEELDEDEDEDDGELDEDVEDPDDLLEYTYKRRKKQRVYRGGGVTGSEKRTGAGMSMQQLKRRAAAQRKWRRTTGKSKYRKSLKRQRRRRRMPRIQRILQRRREKYAQGKSLVSSNQIIDRLQDLLSGLEEATGYEFGIDDNGELFYYDEE